MLVLYGQCYEDLDKMCLCRIQINRFAFCRVMLRKAFVSCCSSKVIIVSNCTLKYSTRKPQWASDERGLSSTCNYSFPPTVGPLHFTVWRTETYLCVHSLHCDVVSEGYGSSRKTETLCSKILRWTFRTKSNMTGERCRRMVVSYWIGNIPCWK
jgi:hypothetical protein